MTLLNKAILVTLAAAVIAGASVVYLQQRSTLPVNAVNMTGEGVEQLPEFSFTDVDGNTRNSTEWQGKILVINFWATWCPPCREEMPLFVSLQKRYAAQGVQFIAIAIDEPGLVRDFYDVYSINFPTMIGGADAIKLANTLGNKFDSLPFTAIFDRKVNSHYIQAGQVTEKILIAEFDKLLHQS